MLILLARNQIFRKTSESREFEVLQLYTQIKYLCIEQPLSYPCPYYL